MRMYIISHYLDYGDQFVWENLFITNDEEKAKKYCDKYNQIAAKWQDYFASFSNNFGLLDYKKNPPKFVEERFYSVFNYSRARYEEIEVR